MSNELKEELHRSNGYILAYSDALKVLTEMLTDKNRDLLVEISERLKHNLNIREATGYLPNNDIWILK